ncbi:Gfo/Idh/MocA family oxidoreductase [Tepidiforma sp.]|uniref:Gfo/Idh/MocA family oxidoreductase n=1 Tax=Tepidiforma sp. TaxID=2682230 RepID=UPI002ADE050D|nr:Gfo/Idh/MocA family oxidoreductase [Tepidiforma sp.]
MSTLRAAVIGLGSMGANHVRVLADTPGVELVAVADPDPERVQRAIAGRSIPGFASTSALLAESRPDFVSVVVPTGLHEEVAVACIEAGAHVLVEKPIAATLEAAARIARAAEDAGVLLTVGHIERFNPAIRELARRLREGQGGRVLQLRARRVGPFPHRIRDVGVIHDLGPHDIDIMRYLLDDEVVRVYAESRAHIATDNEDLFAGMLTFRNGAMGLLDINWLTPTKERTLTILCEKGMFTVDYAAQVLCFYENYAAAARDGVYASVTEGPMTRYPIPNREPLRVELEAFRDAILAGGPPPVPASDGMAALAIAEALVRSGQSGQPVDLAEVSRLP